MLKRVGGRLLTAALARARVSSLILTALGLAALLCYPMQLRAVETSENALLVGHATATFDASLLETVGSMQHADGAAPLNAAAMASPVTLAASLTALLQTQFHVHGPHGTVYGFIRGPRADGKESLLFVVPHSYANESDSSEQSLTLAAALLRHLQSVRWLARDVGLLVLDRATADRALLAWTQAYAGDPSSGVPSLHARGGVIAAAIGLDRDGPGCSRALQVALVGADGLLPNMDLYALLASVVPYSTPLTLSRWSPLDRAPELLAPWLPSSAVPAAASLAGLTQFALEQLRVQPASPLGYFAWSNTPALGVTVLATPCPPAAARASTVDLARSLELAVRSLASLHERFHHSVRLYLLASPASLVSYGDYVYALLLLAVALALPAYAALQVAAQGGGRQALEGAAVLCCALHAVGLGAALVLSGRAGLQMLAAGHVSAGAAVGLAAAASVAAVCAVFGLRLAHPSPSLWTAVRGLAGLEAAGLVLVLTLVNFGASAAIAVVSTVAVSPWRPCCAPRVGLALSALTLGAILASSPLVGPMLWAAAGSDGGLLSVHASALAAWSTAPSLVCDLVCALVLPAHSLFALAFVGEWASGE